MWQQTCSSKQKIVLVTRRFFCGESWNFITNLPYMSRNVSRMIHSSLRH
uniref:Uncharacterized protein n=1 Tax=Arundo donax TaxID=35708 RepID=A0A0A9BJF9_ARUDO